MKTLLFATVMAMTAISPAIAKPNSTCLGLGLQAATYLSSAARSLKGKRCRWVKVWCKKAPCRSPRWRCD
jgi:hypothetical protein